MGIKTTYTLAVLGFLAAVTLQPVEGMYEKENKPPVSSWPNHQQVIKVKGSPWRPGFQQLKHRGGQFLSEAKNKVFPKKNGISQKNLGSSNLLANQIQGYQGAYSGHEVESMNECIARARAKGEALHKLSNPNATAYRKGIKQVVATAASILTGADQRKRDLVKPLLPKPPVRTTHRRLVSGKTLQPVEGSAYQWKSEKSEGYTGQRGTHSNKNWYKHATGDMKHGDFNYPTPDTEQVRGATRSGQNDESHGQTSYRLMTDRRRLVSENAHPVFRRLLK